MLVGWSREERQLQPWRRRYFLMSLFMLWHFILIFTTNFHSQIVLFSSYMNLIWFLPTPVFRNMSQVLMPQILMQSLQINGNLFSREKPEWLCTFVRSGIPILTYIQRMYCSPSLAYYDWLCIIEIELHLQYFVVGSVGFFFPKALTRSVYYYNSEWGIFCNLNEKQQIKWEKYILWFSILDVFIYSFMPLCLSCTL